MLNLGCVKNVTPQNQRPTVALPDGFELDYPNLGQFVSHPLRDPQKTRQGGDIWG